MKKNSFCGWCGTRFLQTEHYPRVCANAKCHRETYLNPIPVAICLQPVTDASTGRTGLAIAQRAIPPHIGGWTLIGGHMEPGERISEGAAREFYEETSVEVGENLRFVDDRSNGVGHLLSFVEADPIPLSVYLTGKPCRENLALDVMWELRDLAFPLHTEMAAQWFRK